MGLPAAFSAPPEEAVAFQSIFLPVLIVVLCLRVFWTAVAFASVATDLSDHWPFFSEVQSSYFDPVFLTASLSAHPLFSSLFQTACIPL